MSDPTSYGISLTYPEFRRRLRSVREPAMRQAMLHRHLGTADVDTAAAQLQQLLVDAVRGDAEASEMQLSVASFLDQAEGKDALALEALRLAARRHGHTGLAWMLIDPPPAREIDNLRMQQRGRALSLGERRALAAGWDPRNLERLLMDHEPMVIDKLCANPRLGEQHVLSIVTRRPVPPGLLRVVAQHNRWYCRAVVREAIVQNPYGPTGLALRTLPVVPWITVDRVRFAGDLHPAMQRFAEYLRQVRAGRDEGPTPDEPMDPLPRAVE